jgi:thiamine-phosphate pyrophosphorylase
VQGYLGLSAPRGGAAAGGVAARLTLAGELDVSLDLGGGPLGLGQSLGSGGALAGPTLGVEVVAAARGRRDDERQRPAAIEFRHVLRARRAGVDAIVVSPVFPSRSPSAGRVMGVRRFAALARAGGIPAYALGGVTTKNAPRLLSAGAAGLAGVEAFAEALPRI